jgi:hypothetical protein
MELIHPDTKWWNSKLIHDTFSEDEGRTMSNPFEFYASR